MKKSKCSFLIKQLRRPICALVVFAIIFFYYVPSFAFESSDDVGKTFLEVIGEDGAFTPFYTDTAISEWGGDSQLLYRTGVGLQYFPEFFITDFSNRNTAFNTSLNNLSTYLNLITLTDTVTYNSVQYDVTNCPYLLYMGYSSSIRVHVVYVKGEGNIALVNGYLVSDQPCSFYNVSYREDGTVYGTNYKNLSQFNYSSETLYYGNIVAQGDTNCMFYYASMPVYFASSDESTGFTSFHSGDESDFSFSDNNYDFNYLYSENSGGDIIYDEVGEHYNYGTVNHKVFGKPFDSLYYGTTIGINSYMRENANKYWLFTDAKIGVKFAGESNVSEYEQNDSSSISSFIRNNSSTYSTLLDPGLMMGPGGSLAAKLRSGYTNIAGSDFGYTEGIWSDGSFVFPDDSGFGSYYEYTYKPLKNSLLGNSDNKLEVAYLDLTSWFSYDGTNDDILNIDTNSGYYHVRFNLLDGSYNVIQNDISQNLNPVEGENNLPISGIGGVSSGGTGNINVTQGGITNNLNAIIEYLFQLDASGIQNVSQNVGSTIQYVVSNIGDTRNVENGFWDVLKKGYSVIPDDIWNWIKISVTTLLSGAVITWVYNGVRVKRG